MGKTYKLNVAGLKHPFSEKPSGINPYRTPVRRENEMYGTKHGQRHLVTEERIRLTRTQRHHNKQPLKKAVVEDTDCTFFIQKRNATNVIFWWY